MQTHCMRTEMNWRIVNGGQGEKNKYYLKCCDISFSTTCYKILSTCTLGYHWEILSNTMFMHSNHTFRYPCSPKDTKTMTQNIPKHWQQEGSSQLHSILWLRQTPDLIHIKCCEGTATIIVQNSMLYMLKDATAVIYCCCFVYFWQNSLLL